MEAQNKKLVVQLKKAIDLTVELRNTICDIDDDLVHKMDKSETCRDIHDIQNRLHSIAYKNHEFLD